MVPTHMQRPFVEAKQKPVGSLIAAGSLRILCMSKLRGTRHADYVQYNAVIGCRATDGCICMGRFSDTDSRCQKPGQI